MTTPVVGTEPDRLSIEDFLLLNGVILCETPGASTNCSRSSTLVRPLAVGQRGVEGGAGRRAGEVGAQDGPPPAEPNKRTRPTQTQQNRAANQTAANTTEHSQNKACMMYQY